MALLPTRMIVTHEILALGQEITARIEGVGAGVVRVEVVVVVVETIVLRNQ